MNILKKTLCLALLTASSGLLEARTVSNFCDGWQFRKGDMAIKQKDPMAMDGEGWEELSLPHTWNATDMARYKDFYQGKGVYRKEFTLDPALKGKRLFLRFEGVGAVSEVYVNGRLIVSHKGAYGAFVGEMTAVARYDGKNVVVVKADNQARPDVIPVNHVLFGVYGGIYRPVWLIATDPVQITVNDHASAGVYVSQSNVSAQSATVSVRTKLDNGLLEPSRVSLVTSIFDQEGTLVSQKSRNIDLTPQGTQQYTEQFTLQNPHLWAGRPDPYLYRVEVSLQQGGSEIDRVTQPLGLRTYEMRAGDGFYLNGKKYPMYGVTRHQDWQGCGSALSNWQHASDLATIMDVGATTVRFAHYQQSDYIYSKCDSLGLVIWAEIPFVNQVTGQEWDNAHQQLLELIRQSYNHPSIYVWGLHNEVYSPTDYCAQLTRSLHDLAKTEDPGRMTVSTNGYGIADHAVNQNADLQAMNRYYGWYERKIGDILPWVEGLEKKYPWQKLILAEYGADANIAHQTEDLGESLNWGKPWYPETFQTKTHEYQWSVIASHPYIVASYLWNTFDFATPMANRGGNPGHNMKGLVTFDRKTKKDSYYFYKANWSTDPVLYLTQRRNTDREHRTTTVTVYSNMGQPEVRLNGKKLPAPEKGYTAIQYNYPGITLRNGRNVIMARIKKDGKTYTDQIEWFYNGEKSRANEKWENKKDHVGLSAD